MRRAISKSRLDGAPGPDQIPAQALQATITHVVRVINHHSALNNGKAPSQWRQSIIVSIPKKGASTSLENQRGISLMCVSAKLNYRALLNRILPGIIRRLSPLQAGFLPERNTTLQLAALRTVVDDCRKH